MESPRVTNGVRAAAPVFVWNVAIADLVGICPRLAALRGHRRKD
jgi:hypothetical protein